MVGSRALVARIQIVCEQSILLSFDLRRSWYSPGEDVSVCSNSALDSWCKSTVVKGEEQCRVDLLCSFLELVKEDDRSLA